MTVTLTSPVLGKQAGQTHTGPEEPWLLAEGYASQVGYNGPGVKNTGLASSGVNDDLTLAQNREAPGASYEASGGMEVANFAASASITPATGPAAGGTRVTIKGDGLIDVTGVTFGGVAATNLERVNDGEIRVTTGPHAAGAVNVVLTDPDGSATKTNGFTYA